MRRNTCPAAAPEQTPDAAARKRAKADSERAQRDAGARGAGPLLCAGSSRPCVKRYGKRRCSADAAPTRRRWRKRSPRCRTRGYCAGRLAEQRAQLDKLQTLADGLSEQETKLQQQRDAIRAGETDCAARAARCDELDAAAANRAAELPHADSNAAKAALTQAQARHEVLRQALDRC